MPSQSSCARADELRIKRELAQSMIKKASLETSRPEGSQKGPSKPVKNAQTIVAGTLRIVGFNWESCENTKQALYNGKTMALIFSVITQWGTQYGLFQVIDQT